MAKRKVTIEFTEGYRKRAKRLAREAGLPLSIWVVRLVEHEIRIQDGLAAMREWEELDGPLTEEELAEAAAELARADAAARANRTRRRAFTTE